MNKRFIALVPSYEPDNELKNVVEDLNKHNFTVIVVDDGSGKEYKRFFDVPASKIISYEVNRGKGFALKTGLKYIKETYDNYVVVTVDSDGQHKADDAYKLCDYVKNHSRTLVIGKRIRNSRVPVRSKIGNAITRFIFLVATKIHIYDTQSGLRAFNDDIVDYLLSIDGNRFEYEMNVLLYLKKNHIKHKELEIKTIYINSNKGSHFKTIRDSYRIYKQIFKYKWKSIVISLLIIGLILFLILR